MTFRGPVAVSTGAGGDTVSFLPTASLVELRWFQEVSLSTVVLKCVAILPRVSPARTVYRADLIVPVTADFVVVWLLVADASCGGVTPLIGMIRVWPTFRTGAFPKLLAWES